MGNTVTTSGIQCKRRKKSPSRLGKKHRHSGHGSWSQTNDSIKDGENFVRKHWGISNGPLSGVNVRPATEQTLFSQLASKVLISTVTIRQASKRRPWVLGSNGHAGLHSHLSPAGETLMFLVCKRAARERATSRRWKYSSSDWRRLLVLSLFNRDNERKDRRNRMCETSGCLSRESVWLLISEPGVQALPWV